MSERREQYESTDPFMTTRWSLVIAAGQRESPQSDQALAALCESYWYPLYAFVRREGYGPEEAQDLTQEFFALLLEKNYVGQADRRRGKFRSFLLTSLKHFLSNQRDRARAKKRGGGRAILSLDFQSAERQYRLEPAQMATAEQLFERRWALALLDHVLTRLAAEYVAADNATVFHGLKPYLTCEKENLPYRKVAEDLDMTEGAVKVAVHRLRKRYRRLLEEEIRQTVSSADEVEEEIQQLFAAVRAEKSTGASNL